MEILKAWLTVLHKFRKDYFDWISFAYNQKYEDETLKKVDWLAYIAQSMYMDMLGFDMQNSYDTMIDAFETAGGRRYTISLEKIKKIDNILVTSNPEDDVQNSTSISVNDDRVAGMQEFEDMTFHNILKICLTKWIKVALGDEMEKTCANDVQKISIENKKKGMLFVMGI